MTGWDPNETEMGIEHDQLAVDELVIDESWLGNLALPWKARQLRSR